MISDDPNTPQVLVLAGHDPSGGAGIQADIEALASQGCRALPVITGLTVQNTARFEELVPVEAELFKRQLTCLLDDMPVTACKIGMVGDATIAQVIHDILTELPDLPVILDPVLASGTGTDVGGDTVISAINDLLLPHCLICTPNSVEARRLTGCEDLDDAAAKLISSGCEYVLLTGTHEDTDTVVNSLYGSEGLIDRFEVPRLPGEYHGSGCTLASALAGLIAQGVSVETAVIEALRYTMESLEHALAVGQGQLIPDRLFWSRDG